MREAEVTVARPHSSCATKIDEVDDLLDRRVDALVEGPEPDVPALLGGLVHVRDHQHEGDQEQIAEDRRPETDMTMARGTE